LKKISVIPEILYLQEIRETPILAIMAIMAGASRAKTKAFKIA
jgi:hypothetical protein